LPVQETAVRLLGDLGRAADDKELAEIVEILIKQFGSKNSHLREIVYIQLGDIATYRNKTPYNLLLPYLDRISVLLAESLVTSGTINGHTIDFIGYKSEAFYKLEAPRKNVVPTLVLRQNRPALDSIAGILQQRLPMMLIEEAPNILAKVFLAPQHTDRCLHFVMSILGERVADNKSRVTVETYVRTQIVALVVNIMVELGGQSIDGQEFATQALHNVQRYVEDVGDLGSFLKPHMLGILHKVSEDLMMPKTTAHKVNIIRSIGKLIQLVGDSMASFSAQVS
jgi:serine/threonine-protein kinase ATR